MILLGSCYLANWAVILQYAIKICAQHHWIWIARVYSGFPCCCGMWTSSMRQVNTGKGINSRSWWCSIAWSGKSRRSCQAAGTRTFFSQHADKLICLDEIQCLPGIFTVLRSVITHQRRGRLLSIWLPYLAIFIPIISYAIIELWMWYLPNLA